MATDPVNQLNRKFTREFAENMNRLKPANPRDPNYHAQLRAWQKAFAFTAALRNTVNDENNRIILVGNPNRSR